MYWMLYTVMTLLEHFFLRQPFGCVLSAKTVCIVLTPGWDTGDLLYLGDFGKLLQHCDTASFVLKFLIP